MRHRKNRENKKKKKCKSKTGKKIEIGNQNNNLIGVISIKKKLKNRRETLHERIYNFFISPKKRQRSGKKAAKKQEEFF